MTRRTHQDGFTLLEVLVAFSILVVGLAGVYRIYLGGLRNEAIAKQESTALLWAQTKLAAVGVSEPLTAGSGDFGDGFSWRVDLAALASGAGRPTAQTPGAVWVTAAVGWQPATSGAQRTVALTTLKLVPQP